MFKINYLIYYFLLTIFSSAITCAGQDKLCKSAGVSPVNFQKLSELPADVLYLVAVSAGEGATVALAGTNKEIRTALREANGGSRLEIAFQRQTSRFLAQQIRVKAKLARLDAAVGSLKFQDERLERMICFLKELWFNPIGVFGFMGLAPASAALVARNLIFVEDLSMYGIALGSVCIPIGIVTSAVLINERRRVNGYIKQREHLANRIGALKIEKEEFQGRLEGLNENLEQSGTFRNIWNRLRTPGNPVRGST